MINQTTVLIGLALSIPFGVVATRFNWKTRLFPTKKGQS